MSNTAEPPAQLAGRRPTLGLLAAIFVLHTTIWIGLVRLLPGDDFLEYPDLGDAATPWIRQFVLPLVVVTAFLVGVVSWLGWWRPVLREPRTGGRLLVLGAALIVVLGGGRLLGSGFSDAPAAYWIGLALTTGLVGLTEELSFRGIQLVGARAVFGDERRALLWSSVLFGLFHLPNAILGASVGAAVAQVFLTALIGTGIACFRRLSGTLLVPVVVHAVYDFVLIQGAFD